MKTVKPQRLGVMTRVFEHERACHFAVSVLAYVPLDAPSVLLPEVALWKFLPTELGRDAAIDPGMPKARGEVVVTGRAFAAGGTPQPASTVRVALGTVDKSVRVVGERYWDPASGAVSRIEPFTEMPLTWERAFGGEGFDQNPIGKGFKPTSRAGGEIRFLPNLEDPRRPMRSPDDRPPPVGLGPVDFTWPQRFAKAGTYDPAWMKELFPGFARDIDWTIFNVAQPDQWIDGFFAGDERFTLEGMHPTKPVVEGRLPGLNARVFVTKKAGDAERFVELQTRLDTVWFFPHADRALLIYRAVTRVEEDDAADVVHLLLAAEAKGAPRTIDHYEAVLRKRLDRTTGPAALLHDDDLLPAMPKPAGRAADETKLEDQDVLQTSGRLKRNLENRRRAELAKARERAAARGIDPATVIDPELEKPAQDAPPDDPADWAAKLAREQAIAEKTRAEMDLAREAQQQKLREACARSGIDYESALEQARREAAGPPRFTAVGQIEELRNGSRVANRGRVDPAVEALVSDPDFQRKLLAQERQLREAYRRFAHYKPAADRMAPARIERVRKGIVRRLLAGESLAERDLTGADLSGLDLRNIDLRGSFLECVNLMGADLRGARLDRAVLVRTDLTQAKLEGATLVDANLGDATLVETDFAGADLTAAVLARARVRRARFTRAKLARADFSEADFDAVDFTGIDAPELTFVKGDLTRATFVDAKLPRANFIETTLARADFTRADVAHGTMVTVKADGALFRHANLENLRVVAGCDFAGADFGAANLRAACLRGSAMPGCDFNSAEMDKADLSECDLRGARFYKVRARESLWVRADVTDASFVSANLMYAIFQKATIEGADLLGANLFRADFARIKGGTRHQAEAFAKQVRVFPVRAHGPR